MRQPGRPRERTLAGHRADPRAPAMATSTGLKITFKPRGSRIRRRRTRRQATQAERGRRRAVARQRDDSRDRRVDRTTAPEAGARRRPRPAARRRRATPAGRARRCARGPRRAGARRGARRGGHHHVQEARGGHDEYLDDVERDFRMPSRAAPDLGARPARPSSSACPGRSARCSRKFARNGGARQVCEQLRELFALARRPVERADRALALGREEREDGPRGEPCPTTALPLPQVVRRRRQDFLPTWKRPFGTGEEDVGRLHRVLGGERCARGTRHRQSRSHGPRNQKHHSNMLSSSGSATYWSDGWSRHGGCPP